MDNEISIPQEVSQIIEDIKSIKIQGATNVALAVFDGLKKWLTNHEILENVSRQQLLEDFRRVGDKLAWARPNEPLAKNGVKYVIYNVIVKGQAAQDPEIIVKLISDTMESYVNLIRSTKDVIVKNGVKLLSCYNEILTHCHSSTAEAILVGVNKARDGNLKVITTETRPRYQGRITATNLLAKGLDVTMVVDSAAASFTYDNRYLPVDAVILGIDQINVDGSGINKVGSLGLALSAYMGNKPIYVTCPLLKLDVSTTYSPIEIELRDAHEIWSEAPSGLNIINPAFEVIPEQFITGYITEFGILKPSEVQDRMLKEYGWVV
ncbi:translation initiation factor eIF-2B [Candidatus Dojkabacteria bacterium]|nr:translation initiation factor eIF-2B [Candidatus Dojkabacteria bacterium]